MGIVSFNPQGIVTSADSQASGTGMLTSNISQSVGTYKSTVVASTTKQQIPVFTNHNSRICHRSNCPDLGNADLIQFASSQKARECGGTPCKHCNPS